MSEGADKGYAGAIFELFQEDLKKHVDSLNKQMECCKDPSNTLTALEKMADICRQLKSSAFVAQIKQLGDLAKQLENFFTLSLKHKWKWGAAHENLIQEIIYLLETICSTPFIEIPAFLNCQEAVIAGLEAKLNAACKKEGEAQEIEKEEVKQANAVKKYDPALLLLFLTELETQIAAITNGILALEKQPDNLEALSAMMRAAHSIKGAARAINLDYVVKLAHAVEDYLLLFKMKAISSKDTDKILHCIDIFSRLLKIPLEKIPEWIANNRECFDAATACLKAQESSLPVALVSIENEPAVSEKNIPLKAQDMTSQDRTVRVTAQNLNRLMGLAGESLVESSWLQPFSSVLMTLKRSMGTFSDSLNQLREAAQRHKAGAEFEAALSNLQHLSHESQQNLTARLGEFEMFIRRHHSLSERFYQEIVDIRMRPFADGVEGFPRIVRDLAKQLGKKVKLEIQGKNTSVDRDILDKLEAPLTHLLWNAIDHGIESPEQRLAKNKPAEGTIKMEARHKAGSLVITITDDGRGIDLQALRQKIKEKKMADDAFVEKLHESELIEFIFLPGFSTSQRVTEISGRGVGLNIVHKMCQEVGGAVKAYNQAGLSLKIEIHLPITLSVIRCLMVHICGEVYAFPLSRIDRALHIPKEEIRHMEGRQYFSYYHKNIGLIEGSEVLELSGNSLHNETLAVVIFSEKQSSYGMLVDCFLGEKDLVVQELDTHLGKIRDISTGAILENGSPVLILDVDDLIQSIDKLLSQGSLKTVTYQTATAIRESAKRILVVDDSITVREVECRLLQNHGYKVDTAVNGVDGWNAVRVAKYDLIITDIDMPRMNGIELVKAIRADSKLHNLPIMIISYKDREEDKKLGLAAGANYYLTKNSFHDDALLVAVEDLIGKSTPYQDEHAEAPF